MTCVPDRDTSNRPSYYVFEFFNERFQAWFPVQTLDFLNDEISHICNCGGVHWVHERGIKKALDEGLLKLIEGTICWF